MDKFFMASHYPNPYFPHSLYSTCRTVWPDGFHRFAVDDAHIVGGGVVVGGEDIHRRKAGWS